tara:strand:- start:4 stop:297 length:294 start_codon:yes stop_codon:yes gene_type:complete
MNFKELESENKLRGGYYTPKYLSDYIIWWIKKSAPKKILEPSCGDGVFINSIENNIEGAQVTGVEIIKDEAQKSGASARSRTPDRLITNQLLWPLSY